MKNKYIHYQIKNLAVNLVDSPCKTNKKLDTISLKNNITKTLVPLCDLFNSSFNGSFYLRFKKN